MRENRKSGSEGGAIQTNVSLLPLSMPTVLPDLISLPRTPIRGEGEKVVVRKVRGRRACCPSPSPQGRTIRCSYRMT